MSYKPHQKETILIVDDNMINLRVLIDYLNQSGLKILIATNGKEAIQRAMLAHPDLILLDIMMPVMDGFETCRQLKSINSTQDIPIIFISAQTNILNKIEGFRVGGVDYITKPFEHEEVLSRISIHLTIQRQKKELKELSSMKDKFMSIIAHDMCNAFSSIVNGSSLLINNINNQYHDKSKSLAEHINSSAVKSYKLLKNLLDWARIQRGVITVKPIKIQINQIIDSNIILFKESAGQKNITITNNVFENISVYSDFNMTNTIIRNLMQNAIKFTKKGGKINFLSEKNDKNIVICVSDNGIGISNDDMKKLFTLGEPLKTRGTDDEEGTGLGLILCKEMIEKNKGQIWVESEYGKGSTFFVSLPKCNNE